MKFEGMSVLGYVKRSNSGLVCFSEDIVLEGGI